MFFLYVDEMSNFREVFKPWEYKKTLSYQNRYFQYQYR